MAHTIEPAASGRAKCRGCGEPIAKGELRLGARLANPFDDEKELTLWFHLPCAAYTRPEPLLEAMGASSEEIPNRDSLESEAKAGIEHPRVTRVRGIERARTGRAACRHCREAIPKDAWRIALVYYDEEEGRFSPSGFIHVTCAGDYLETKQILGRLKHFSPALDPAELDTVASELGLET